MAATEHFVDANVFLRFLTNDVPEQADAAEGLFRRAGNGEVVLYTNALIIAEIVWTLESYYEVRPEGILDRIMAILNTPGLKVEEDELVGRALTLYVSENIDFIDAYNGLWMKDRGLSSAVSFDLKHFRRIPGIVAHTPEDVD